MLRPETRGFRLDVPASADTTQEKTCGLHTLVKVPGAPSGEGINELLGVTSFGGRCYAAKDKRNRLKLYSHVQESILIKISRVISFLILF